MYLQVANLADAFNEAQTPAFSFEKVESILFSFTQSKVPSIPSLI